MTHPLIERIAQTIVLGEALMLLKQTFGSYTLLAHWLQGEFHHDLLFHVPNAQPALPGAYVLIDTNCNGGIKEVLCLDEAPERWALWHHRCPENPEFEGSPVHILAQAKTEHWFNPCELLVKHARSELRPEHRQRQRGGGWVMKDS
jgi:hypothetical protein